MELEAKQLPFDLSSTIRKFPDRVSTEAIYPLFERAQSSVMLGLHYGLRIPSFEEPILHEIIDIQTRVTHHDTIRPCRDLPRE
jgi:hypothetical protein